MPEISRFYGIVIRMHYNDHTPPHLHAEYGEYVGTFDILTGQLLEGRLPLRASRLVTSWVNLRRKDLLRNWDAARLGLPLQPVAPME